VAVLYRPSAMTAVALGHFSIKAHVKHQRQPHGSSAGGRTAVVERKVVPVVCVCMINL